MPKRVIFRIMDSWVYMYISWIYYGNFDLQWTFIYTGRSRRTWIEMIEFYLLQLGRFVLLCCLCVYLLNARVDESKYLSHIIWMSRHIDDYSRCADLLYNSVWLSRHGQIEVSCVSHVYPRQKKTPILWGFCETKYLDVAVGFELICPMDHSPTTAWYPLATALEGI